MSEAVARGIPSRETILIAEDEGSVRNFMRIALGMAGYRVLESSTGPAALAQSTDYDGAIHVLLTDLSMPGMSGAELAHRISASRPDIKIVYISGHSEDEAFPGGQLPLNSSYIQKPCTIRALRNVIEELLERTIEVATGSSTR